MKYNLNKVPSSAFELSLLALLTSLTTVATVILIIPFPSTQGYFNLGDCLVMISGFLLGPVGGFVAGAAGSAFADIMLGYPAYAPITFVAKGTEGFLVGLLASRTARTQKISVWDILGLLLGSCAMLLGYLLGEMYLLGYTFEIALLELITINSIQVIAGSLAAVLAGPIVRDFLRNLPYLAQENELEDVFESIETESQE